MKGIIKIDWLTERTCPARPHCHLWYAKRRPCPTIDPRRFPPYE